MKQITINSKLDNKQLALNIYEADETIAVCQVIHGMMEHQLRYKTLAEKLTKIGITVITSDLRGHGNKTEESYLGHIESLDALIVDQLTITDYINKNYNKPIYIFAHSMGTIITRNLLQKNDKLYSKVILSGAPNYIPVAGIGAALAGMISLFKGKFYKSKLLENMSIGNFNKIIDNPVTKSDWLSYNQENVKNYINDPYCGFPFTTIAYKTLFKAMAKMGKKYKYQVNNPNLPIYLIAGYDDPCTGGIKGILSTTKFLQKLGYPINVKTYENMRHEILNETNPNEVYYDIINFFNS